MSKVFKSQFTNPRAYWVNGCYGARIRFLPDTAERARLMGRPACGPSDKNGSVLAVTAPTVPGPGVRILDQLPFDFDVPGTEERFQDYCMAIYQREQAAKVAL